MQAFPLELENRTLSHVQIYSEHSKALVVTLTTDSFVGNRRNAVDAKQIVKYKKALHFD